MFTFPISPAREFGSYYSRTEPARLPPAALLKVAREPPYGLYLLARPPTRTPASVPLIPPLSGEKRPRLILLGL